MHGDFDHERVSERPRDLAEELTGEVRLVAVPQEGLPMKGIDAVEETRVEVSAEARLEADSGLGHAPALAPRLLALLRREGLEIGVEAGVAVVAPVELTVAPQQPTRFLAGRARGLVEEERVHGGQAAARRVILERLEQVHRDRATVEPRAHEKPWAGRGRKGYGDHEFGVVAPPIA